MLTLASTPNSPPVTHRDGEQLRQRCQCATRLLTQLLWRLLIQDCCSKQIICCIRHLCAQSIASVLSTLAGVCTHEGTRAQAQVKMRPAEQWGAAAPSTTLAEILTLLNKSCAQLAPASSRSMPAHLVLWVQRPLPHEPVDALYGWVEGVIRH